MQAPGRVLSRTHDGPKMRAHMPAVTRIFGESPRQPEAVNQFVDSVPNDSIKRIVKHVHVGSQHRPTEPDASHAVKGIRLRRELAAPEGQYFVVAVDDDKTMYRHVFSR